MISSPAAAIATSMVGGVAMTGGGGAGLRACRLGGLAGAGACGYLTCCQVMNGMWTDKDN